MLIVLVVAFDYIDLVQDCGLLRESIRNKSLTIPVHAIQLHGRRTMLLKLWFWIRGSNPKIRPRIVTLHIGYNIDEDLQV